MKYEKFLRTLFIIVAPLLIANECPGGDTSGLTTSRTTGNFTIPSSGQVNGYLDRSLRSPTACVRTNDTPAGSIRREPQIYFNECDPAGGLTARYFENGSCTATRRVSRDFHQHMRQNLKACVEEGTGKSIQNVNLIHAGIAGDSSHSSRSLHSMNRAIDIKAFQITYTNGRTETISSSEQAQRASFFQRFARCWSSSITEQSSSSCPGSLPKGFIGHEDPDHTRHIHISLPYCPQKSGTGAK